MIVVNISNIVTLEEAVLHRPGHCRQLFHTEGDDHCYGFSHQYKLKRKLFSRVQVMVDNCLPFVMVTTVLAIVTRSNCRGSYSRGSWP
jgi:hypothetical protein